MFNKVFVENDILENKYTQRILAKLKCNDHIIIDNYQDIFQKVKKPYLQKRTNLNLFIARKKGHLVKETPDAYGLDGEKHYYFIHSYNCIYECDYCYLQGYFNSPDLVFFVNHDEIINEMQDIVDKTDKRVWFHAGEFSDSLALSHLSNELSAYIEFLDKNPKALMELRTKSVNTKLIPKPRENLFITFSLSPAMVIKEHDLKTPSMKHRLSAIKKLANEGHKIGIHLDPIIYTENFEKNYKEMIAELNKAIEIKNIEYISIGVVRFTKDVWHEVKSNYPESNIHAQELTQSENGLIRYNKPMRMWILNKVKEIILEYSIDEKKVYMCME